MLDDDRYTFKCLGAGFWGLRNGTDFRKAIMKLIMEAGDADRCVCLCLYPFCKFTRVDMFVVLKELC